MNADLVDKVAAAIIGIRYPHLGRDARWCRDEIRPGDRSEAEAAVRAMLEWAEMKAMESETRVYRPVIMNFLAALRREAGL